MSDSVPQELVDFIVKNLKGDTPSLKSCSFAARTFVGPSQAHLSEDRVLPPPETTRTATHARDFTKPSLRPHLTTLVEELLVGSETSFEYDADGQYPEERHPFGLRRISVVENLPGEWNGGGDFSMKWSTLGRSLKSALTDDLLSLFSDATALKCLSLSRVYFERDFEQPWQPREAWPEAQPWRPQLTLLP
ncbi:hypothetical protein FB45DRAFT_1018831 [Roridomyces roridus]|uniref:Uncharacterized protein n=1 Tax=Roridomyces roridus TaxID=1738132 RepID=A0AAD7CDM6_9AGAR|nr:hypothetical protein FB45DRAFT_1018827 [Roridomyces roridus]KAJ7646514.1 hypothetical protein FB45DRAFT_1018831 [Roridomyces roridus]